MKFIKTKHKQLIEIEFDTSKIKKFSEVFKAIKLEGLKGTIVKIKARIRKEEVPEFESLTKKISKACDLLLTPIPIIADAVRRRDSEQTLELNQEDSFRRFVEIKDPKSKEKILRKGLKILDAIP